MPHCSGRNTPQADIYSASGTRSGGLRHQACASSQFPIAQSQCSMLNAQCYTTRCIALYSSIFYSPFHFLLPIPYSIYTASTITDPPHASALPRLPITTANHHCDFCYHRLSFSPFLPRFIGTSDLLSSVSYFSYFFSFFLLLAFIFLSTNSSPRNTPRIPGIMAFTMRTSRHATKLAQVSSLCYALRFSFAIRNSNN